MTHARREPRPGPAPSRPGPVASGSIGRAASVIDLLRAAAVPMTLSEIGRKSGLAKSTTHRLLNSLVACGMVHKHGTTYAVSAAAASRAARDPGDAHLRRLLAPCLSELYVSVRKTVSLAVLKGFDVIYLERIHAPAVPWTAIDEQGSAPALATAGGRLLLAYRGDGTHGDADRGALPETVDSPELRAALARIRQARFAMTECDATRRTVCIAVPVIGPDSAPCAAFTATGLAPEVNVPRTLHALWTFATIAAENLARSTASCRPG